MGPISVINRIRKGKPIVVVSGLPRSGTSMLMKMLEAGGMEIASDFERKADVDNPKGYYELERVKELGQGKDESWVKELRGKAVKIISFLLKELPNNNMYKIIFLERNLEEVIASQNKMLVHRGEAVSPENDSRMIRTFQLHLDETKGILKKNPNFETIYLNHRSIINDPREQAEKISRYLNLNGRIEEMAGIVDPSLHRNRT